MGWGLKIGLFFFALIAATFGAWIITLPIMALLFLPPLLNRKGKGTKQSAPSPRPPKGNGPSYVSIAGALLVLLSLVAFFSGGIFSPIVFTGVGFALLLRHRFSVPMSGRVKPVGSSILLRRGLVPFRWSAVAEAKVATRDVEGALSGVNERLLLACDPNPRIFLAFSTSSLSRARAEENLVGRMQAAARSLSSLGVYLLPLDGTEAAGAAVTRSDAIEPATENLRQFISAADYGVALVEALHGFVTGFELYARPDPAQNARSVLSGIKEKNVGQLTLREFLSEVLQRIGTPQPDRYVAFLSSMAATEGEGLGQRITETSQGPQEQVLLVASIGSPQVELTRAQLQAISTIYE